MKKVLITAGGTKEHIDDVRVLTNISTGNLSTEIAQQFDELGYEVYYVYATGSRKPTLYNLYGNHRNIRYHEISDVNSLVAIMSELVPNMDVVIHAMAVSDFGFDRTKPVKLKSNDPEGFIEYMRETIKVNPKVLPMIKQWNPNVYLVSFKYEVGLTLNELFTIAIESMDKSGSDAVIANDNVEMVRENQHIGYLLEKTNLNLFRTYGDTDPIERLIGKPEIAEAITNLIK
jgi:phosphopantothenate-cysteine ligase